MVPPGKPRDYPLNKEFKDAAVAILLYLRNNEVYFALIQRTYNNYNDKHNGQISLPGGRLDISDNSLLDCALRELEEELGVLKSQVNPLGRLTDLYIPVSNFKVQPFIVFSKNNINFTPQPSEVDYVLEIELKDLFDENNLKMGTIKLDSGVELQDIPYFNLNNHIVWGATAMILNEFKIVLNNIKTNLIL
jgi:8-oxo-dGTP pyrophosphatase MutT (NUDIX family)